MLKKIIALTFCLVFCFTSCKEKPSATIAQNQQNETFGYDPNKSEEEIATTNNKPILEPEKNITDDSTVDLQQEKSEYNEPDYPEGVLGFKENNYMVASINDIYYNFSDYEGKTIGYEGMVMYVDNYLPDGTVYEKACAVARYGPGCCGVDALVGFAIYYTGEEKLEEGQWVRVIGEPKLKTFDEIYVKLELDVISIEKIEQHGSEYVYH